MADKNLNLIVRTLVGFLWLVIFSSITSIAAHVIDNDKCSRARDIEARNRDDTMRKDFTTHCIKAEKQFHEYAMTQEKTNGKLLVMMEGVAKDIEHMRKVS